MISLVKPTRVDTAAVTRLRVGNPGLAIALVLTWLLGTTVVLVRAWLAAPPTWVFTWVGVVIWLVGGGAVWFWSRRPSIAEVVWCSLKLTGPRGSQTIDLSQCRQVTLRSRTINGTRMTPDWEFRPEQRLRLQLLIDLDDQRYVLQLPGTAKGRPAEQFAETVAAANGLRLRRTRDTRSEWQAATDRQDRCWLNPDLGTGSPDSVFAFVLAGVVLTFTWIFLIVFAIGGPTYRGTSVADLPSASTEINHLRAVSATLPPAEEGAAPTSVQSEVQPCQPDYAWLWGPVDLTSAEAEVTLHSELPDADVTARVYSPEMDVVTDRVNGYRPAQQTAASVYLSGQLDGSFQVRVSVECVRGGNDPALRRQLEDTATAIGRKVLADG